MTDRILDFSQEPARLSVRLENLVIERDDQPPRMIPIAEIGVIVVSHPRVSYTHSVLMLLAQKGGAFITCDERRLPVAMLLPLQSNVTQTEIMAAQANAPEPVRKRLWKRIVRAKIKAQARALDACRLDGQPVRALVPDVKSGDSGNIEAQAARRYWSALSGRLLPEGFKRDPDSDWPNPLLNYGYAVLRAIVARALCASGLHPSMGLHHHNRYNPFCLADDLMEPLRPLVDKAVIGFLREKPETTDITKEARAHVIGKLTDRYMHREEARTLFDITGRTAARLAAVFMGEALAKDFVYPEVADDREP
ncbi:MAG: type II CRISPR-associated endonuclease Cas1 [Planctomycetes bacterium]|nr:type II CRISPR-associated endonuclease Cas1 [Planctomycetota bacterium]MCW8135618.1 type II CRISPR-associated endonuclease Cas1 [Planctomycetota bacterium]